MNGAELLQVRVEAIEHALGLPRTVPVFGCRACGREWPELRDVGDEALREACTRCGSRALYRHGAISWPPTLSDLAERAA